MTRVVITGMGIISPVGNSCDEFFDNLAAGRSGIKKMSSDFADRLSVKISAEVDFDVEAYFSKKTARTLDRVSQIAMVAASQSWQDAAMQIPEKEQKRGRG